jgi:chromosome segregation ATPase
MVSMQSPKPHRGAWPPPAPEKAAENLTKYVVAAASESAFFHEAISDVSEVRDDICHADRRGSTTAGSDDDTRDDVEKIDSSYKISEVNSSTSEEFEDVLAELNATESGDGSMEGLLGSHSSETDVCVQKDIETIKTEAEAAVKKMIDTIKLDRGVLANEDTESSMTEATNGAEEVIDATKTEIGQAITKKTAEDQAQSDSYEEPELQTSETEQEFDNVLAELNATESGDGSTEGLIGASNSKDSKTDKHAVDVQEEEQETPPTSSMAMRAAARVLDVALGEDKPANNKLANNTNQATIQSKVQALLGRKAAIGHKLTHTASAALTGAVSKSHLKVTPVHDDSAALDSASSDDSDDAVIEVRPNASTLKTTEITQNTSAIRANLLSSAKQMVDMYKLLLDNDGFSGDEGKATRHFLAELGSELKMGKCHSRDAASLKTKLISRENDVLKLEKSVASKDELVADLQTQNSSLRDELNACKTKLASVGLVNDSVFKERDGLKKWKADATVTMKNQSNDLDQLIEQNSTLLDLCNEKEEFIKDLAQWKIEAETTIESQSTKLSELTSQASHLLEVCGEQQSSIKDLVQFKTDAEKTMETQAAAMKKLIENNDSLSTRCQEQHDVIEDMTSWKTGAKDRLKRNEEELSRLKSDNAILLNKCNDQQAAIDKHLKDINTLSHKLEVETFAVSRFEEDFLEHSKNMMILKETIKSKTGEVEALTATIEELKALNSQMAEQAKNAPNTERENQEKEKIAMKMNHHKELSYLKTQKLSLASRVDDLLAEQEEFKSQIEALSGNAVLLEKELKAEREKHKETRSAVEGMEKALVVSNVNHHH